MRAACSPRCLTVAPGRFARVSHDQTLDTALTTRPCYGSPNRSILIGVRTRRRRKETQTVSERHRREDPILVPYSALCHVRTRWRAALQIETKVLRLPPIRTTSWLESIALPFADALGAQCYPLRFSIVDLNELEMVLESSVVRFSADDPNSGAFSTKELLEPRVRAFPCSPFAVVQIVPTGVRCEFGGHAIMRRLRSRSPTPDFSRRSRSAAWSDACRHRLRSATRPGRCY